MMARWRKDLKFYIRGPVFYFGLAALVLIFLTIGMYFRLYRGH